MGVGRLSGGCWKSVEKVWDHCMEGVVRLSEEYGQAVLRVWEGCLEV